MCVVGNLKGCFSKNSSGRSQTAQPSAFTASLLPSDSTFLFSLQNNMTDKTTHPLDLGKPWLEQSKQRCYFYSRLFPFFFIAFLCSLIFFALKKEINLSFFHVPYLF